MVSHPRSPTIPSVPVIDAIFCDFKAVPRLLPRQLRAPPMTVKVAVAATHFAQPARGVPLAFGLWLTDPTALSTHSAPV